MHLYNPNECWNKSFELSYAWIIIVPILAFLAVSTLQHMRELFQIPV